jgi:hypothetical protein
MVVSSISASIPKRSIFKLPQLERCRVCFVRSNSRKCVAALIQVSNPQKDASVLGFETLRLAVLHENRNRPPRYPRPPRSL